MKVAEFEVNLDESYPPNISWPYCPSLRPTMSSVMTRTNVVLRLTIFCPRRVAPAQAGDELLRSEGRKIRLCRGIPDCRVIERLRSQSKNSAGRVSYDAFKAHVNAETLQIKRRSRSDSSNSLIL